MLKLSVDGQLGKQINGPPGYWEPTISTFSALVQIWKRWKTKRIFTPEESTWIARGVSPEIR